MDQKAKLLDFDHICISADGQSRATVANHYCIIGFKNNVFYMWKTVDNVGFEIRFCPFCGINANEAMLQFPRGSITAKIAYIDIPLRQRADCRRCNSNRWREVIFDKYHNGTGCTSIPLVICSECGYLISLQ